MAVYDINYYPPTPGMNPAAAYFQQNPQAANTGIGAALTANTVNPTSGSGMNTPLGMNLGTGQLVLGTIGTLGNLWAAFQAQKLAKEQFEFQKGVTNTNLANQIQSYNTSLIDRINARSFMQGDSQAVTDKYIADNLLKDERNK